MSHKKSRKKPDPNAAPVFPDYASPATPPFATCFARGRAGRRGRVLGSRTTSGSRQASVAPTSRGVRTLERAYDLTQDPPDNIEEVSARYAAPRYGMEFFLDG